LAVAGAVIFNAITLEARPVRFTARRFTAPVVLIGTEIATFPDVGTVKDFTIVQFPLDAADDSCRRR
jgi:hypothetical protein